MKKKTNRYQAKKAMMLLIALTLLLSCFCFSAYAEPEDAGADDNAAGASVESDPEVEGGDETQPEGETQPEADPAQSEDQADGGDDNKVDPTDVPVTVVDGEEETAESDQFAEVELYLGNVWSNAEFTLTPDTEDAVPAKYYADGNGILSFVVDSKYSYVLAATEPQNVSTEDTEETDDDAGQEEQDSNGRFAGFPKILGMPLPIATGVLVVLGAVMFVLYFKFGKKTIADDFAYPGENEDEDGYEDEDEYSGGEEDDDPDEML